MIIEQLPLRFDNKKVSYKATFPYCNPYPVRRIDSLIEYLSRTRPDFIFDILHVDQSSMKEVSNSAEIQDYLMSHAKVLDFTSWHEPLHKTPNTCSAVRRPL